MDLWPRLKNVTIGCSYLGCVFGGGPMVLGRNLNATTAFTLGHVLNGAIGPGLGP